MMRVRGEKNINGYVAVLVALFMPVFILILGVCIDGSIMIYYDLKLMSATKYSAIAATSCYEIKNGESELTQEARFVADKVLKSNLQEAQMISFEVDQVEKNECTVKTKVDIPVFLGAIFNRDVSERSKMELRGSYTAKRIVKPE